MNLKIDAPAKFDRDDAISKGIESDRRCRSDPQAVPSQRIRQEQPISNRPPPTDHDARAEPNARASTALNMNANVNIWDDEALRRLWIEYKRVGATYRSLGKKYDVPYHKIAALMRQANAKFSMENKTAPRNGLGWKSRKHD
jgi:hypothetical protein